MTPPTIPSEIQPAPQRAPFPPGSQAAALLDTTETRPPPYVPQVAPQPTAPAKGCQPGPSTRMLSYNIGDRVRGSLPESWLDREPSSQLAQILRREVAVETDGEGRPYLKDMNASDWEHVEAWLNHCLVPRGVDSGAAPLLNTALRYGLRNLETALTARDEASAGVSGAGQTEIRLRLANAAAQINSLEGLAINPVAGARLPLAGHHSEKFVRVC